MEINIAIGTKGHGREFVSTELTAARYGSGMVEVYATPAMISLMEKTCMESILPLLPDEYNSVGTEVNIKHIKATPVGKWVDCVSILVAQNGKALTFEVKVRDENGLCGEGTHVRYIIHTQRFIDKMNV